VDELVSEFKIYVPDFNLDEVSPSEKYLDIFLILKKYKNLLFLPHKEEKDLNLILVVLLIYVLKKQN
jgi:hypothetical protein